MGDVGNGVRLNKIDFNDLLYQLETYNKFYVYRWNNKITVIPENNGIIAILKCIYCYKANSFIRHLLNH